MFFTGGKGREKTGRGRLALSHQRQGELYYWMLAAHKSGLQAAGVVRPRAYLLFEVANGIFIGIGEKVKDAVFDVVLF